MHAMEWIGGLLDAGSFREIGAEVKNCGGAFRLKEGTVPRDGVVTGYGTIQGKPAVVYAQDFSVMAGTLGRMQGTKIAHAIRMGIENRCPVIGILDSGGARIQEGVDALAAYGDILYYNTLASGYIPQISVIAGKCAGGAAYSPGLTDFIFMLEDSSNLYITGPRVVEAVMHQSVCEKKFGGSRMHEKQSGTVQFVCRDEAACFQKIRKLLSLIPHYYMEETELSAPALPEACGEDQRKGIGSLLPSRRPEVYPMRKILERIADRDSLLEVSEHFAENLITAFGTLQGQTVGFAANNPYCMGGVLDVDSSVKGARFIRYCDSYDIPVVTLVDVPGFMPGTEQEENGIIRHGAKLLYAYGESTVPKITVILRKAYGGAYIAMGSRHMGADFVYAWPGAEIAVMGEEPAVEILFRRELASLDGEARALRFRQIVEDYRKEVMNLDKALSRGYVDAVIEPEETRARILADLQLLKRKRSVLRIRKKHGNIPL